VAQEQKRMINGKKSGFLLIIVAILLLVVLVAWASPSDIAKRIAGIDLRILAFVIVLYFINLATKAFRWKTILERANGHVVPGWKALKIFMVAMGINNVSPGRIMGEPMKVYMAKKELGVDYSAGTTTIFIEKIFDIIFLVAIVSTGFLIIFPDFVSIQGGYVYIFLGIIILLVAACIAIIFIVTREDQRYIKKTFGALLKVGRPFMSTERLSKTKGKIDGFVDGCNGSMRSIKQDRKTLTKVSVLTSIIWINEAVRLFLIMGALGTSVTFGSSLFGANIAAIAGMFIPLGMGNAAMIGVFYSLWGISEDIVITSGIIMSLTSVWMSVSAAALILVGKGLTDARKSLSNHRSPVVDKNKKKNKAIEQDKAVDQRRG